MIPSPNNFRFGFSLLELLVVFGILITLFAIGTINFLGTQRNISLTASIDPLITDLRGQQLKSMVGDADGQAVPISHGVHFENSSYTLFRGSSYSPGSLGNFVVNLNSAQQFSAVTLLNSVAVFNQITGELANFSPGSDSITIRDTTDGQTRTITLNRYGVVVSVQ